MLLLVIDSIKIKFVDLATGLAQMMILQQTMEIILWNVESNDELPQILFCCNYINYSSHGLLLNKMKSKVNSIPNDRLINKNNK
jgi:hypothetical protein